MPNYSAANSTKRLPNLTDPSTIKELLALFQIMPRRSRGQNFITNMGVLDKIVRAAHLTRADLVVEIGPGLGALTTELVQKAGHVVAVEVDPKLYAILQQTFARWPFNNLTFINADALRLDLGALVQKKLEQAIPQLSTFKIVANLPYSITGRIIRRLLEMQPRPETLVCLVQKEVAERITAHVPEMNALAVAVQTYGQPEILGIVKPGSFMPRPQVNSAILRVNMYTKPKYGKISAEKYFKTVRAGFSQKRKRLDNALSAGLDKDKAEMTRLLDKIGIDPAKRAQHLNIEEWQKIAEAISQT